MQRNYIHYIYIFILLILGSCSDTTTALVEPNPEQNDGSIELTGIKAAVYGTTASSTRSSADEYNTDYVGRSTFVADDEMIITKFERTQAALTHYSYKNIFYKSNSDLAWARTKGDGSNGYETADRIYWSDNASYHTFIGYSLPQDWKNEARTDRANKWTKTSLTDVFHGQFSKSSDNYVDFTVNGTFTSANNFTGDFEKEAKTNLIVDKKGTRLKNEDLLLFYNTEQLADIGGMTTTLYYRHALASLRVIIDIREFAVSDGSQDAKTTIKDLLVLNQPWKYKWTQTGTNSNENDTDPGWGVINDTQTGDGLVTIKAWQPRPQGEGTGSNKTFTFYSLIVPGKQTDFNMHYTVTYPKALKPSEMENHTYRVHMDEILFKAGYCTTVRVSLNHRGEPINIGAMYYNWDDVSTPDKSNLQKVSTFLDTYNRTNVTIAGDELATIEDATWLYYEKDGQGNATTILKDIYGHDGTKESPFTIKTARQLLSFAYEVNATKTLKEDKTNNTRVEDSDRQSQSFAGKYVKLEADLFLQKDLKSSDINWPGIGTADKQFNGYFDGGNRIIKLLKGKPLFTNIGANAHIETLQLEDVIGDINGGGCLAEVNNGTLCGCHVYAKNNTIITLNSGSSSYSGFICGVNNGTIFACKTQGDFKSTAQYTGGITGKNEGTIVASIAIGKISSSYSGSGEKVFGGISAQKGTSSSITCCRFDKSIMKDVTPVDVNGGEVLGLTTTEMQKEQIVTDLNNAIISWSETQYSSDADKITHFKLRNYTFHVGQYPRVH